ncbi:BlaI/MecI/CopY family transcriptional regulator [Romeria aff. gracilis LEGE 07310]|uniref:BlaI/MecI/CopY family transcriptional regulator n=1 Tax=Vasconcelosia minhoensis LEGE 07310 TaxID=915328 RepID=A0A8J7DCT8_9CYAN|nr:BlaI/MecI/CopY family transcriptional regulator [Romeria gracilis]MBE9078023.1 BlaI/MecI/CopY family transcriptional regulator [Romeria aff. gracilis LEGE 07310]
MAPLPNSPKKLSLGSLEAEILGILWQLGSATARQIHDQILADPDRELAYASVTTVLNRLTQKGWLKRHKRQRAFVWEPLVSQRDAQVLQAYRQLKQLLAIGNPDIVAAFADELDSDSIERLDAIAQRLNAIRQARKES